MNVLHVLTLNVQGLRNKEKRFRLYEWLKHQNFGVAFLQETHFSDDLFKQINSEIQDFAKIFHSLGKTNSRGVCIMISKKSPISIIDSKSDNEGRYVMLNLELEDNFYTLLNLYAPNDEKNRNVFF